MLEEDCIVNPSSILYQNTAMNQKDIELQDLKNNSMTVTVGDKHDDTDQTGAGLQIHEDVLQNLDLGENGHNVVVTTGTLTTGTDGGMGVDDDDDDVDDDDDDDDLEAKHLMVPLVSSNMSSNDNEFRIRKRNNCDDNTNYNMTSPKGGGGATTTGNGHFLQHEKREKLKQCCSHAMEIQKNVLRNTITVMNFLARVLFWASVVVMVIGVVWYSKELALHGTDAHLIAWFSAGAFVILGFPISIYGILMHLTNYYQPNIQCYVVRILWMVPIYSIESWLCLRFHEFAIYIETLRDCYESFVLYCFLQFLIEVLGGEESLIMMLKDKSPTRGVHYVPLNWFMKPWVMGQPVSTIDPVTNQRSVLWTSPFFKYCKLGCLQYVLLKFVSAVFVMGLEHFNLYKEGDFTVRGGYLYICILTNLSQCWALYCLVFFYYATKNELGPIRPVGKFLAVKSLVFFTWWQALGISMLHEMKLIPSYEAGGWTTEEVAKGLQAYLICIEMFVAAIIHLFVFPHTDYLKPLAISKPHDGIQNFKGRRVGRRFNQRTIGGVGGGYYKDDRSYCSKASDAQTSCDLEPSIPRPLYGDTIDEVSPTESYNIQTIVNTNTANSTTTKSEISNNGHQTMDNNQNNLSPIEQQQRKGFVHALIDSTLPRDVMSNTVGIARGDFTVEKKTLLYHAAASDQYALFAKRRKKVSMKNDATSSVVR